MGNSASRLSDPEVRERLAHGPVPLIDFDSIPVLQPQVHNGSHRPGESSIDSSQSYGMVAFPVVSNEAVIRDSTSSQPIIVTQASPSLSYNASIGTMSSPEMDFNERRQMSSRRASIASRAWDNDEPIDVGMPPAVPPHRILSGRVVLPPPSSSYSDGQPSPPMSTASAESKASSNSGHGSATTATSVSGSGSMSVNTEVYTRKCSFHHRNGSMSTAASSSPNGRSRASSRASGTFPGLEPENGFDSPTSSNMEISKEPSSPETPSFALEGYQRGSTLLRVVNVDSDCSDTEDTEEAQQLKIKKSRFFVPSKAVLAEQTEKEAAWRHRYQRYGHQLPRQRPVRSVS